MSPCGSDPVIIEICQLKHPKSIHHFCSSHTVLQIGVLVISDESVPWFFCHTLIHRDCARSCCIDKPDVVLYLLSECGVNDDDESK